MDSGPSVSLLCWSCGPVPLDGGLTPSPMFSPDLAHLLATNDQPSENVIPDARIALYQLQSRLSELTIRTETVRAALGSLRAERKEMKRQLRAMSGVLSPIRRLPVEILSEIFLCVHATTPQQTPWRLGHICRAWRAVALGLPCLWSSIRLGLGLPTYDLRLLLKEQLWRSMAAPLRIEIGCGDWISEGLAATFRPALVPLIQEAHRWESLAVPAITRIRASRLGALLRSVHAGTRIYTQLRRLTLENLTSVEDAMLYKDAPALTHLALLGSPISLRDLPWRQLTHFYANETTSCRPTLRVLFEYAPGLVELVSRMHAYTQPAFKTVTLPHLRRLVLHNASYLEHLRAPSLQSLCTRASSETMRRFIHRSSLRDTLKRLAISDSALVEPLIDVLKDVPALESLVLHGRYKDTLRLDTLYRSSTRWPFPSLTSFSILRRPSSSSQPPSSASSLAVRVAFNKFARSRIGTLRRLRVSFLESDLLFGKSATAVAALRNGGIQEVTVLNAYQTELVVDELMAALWM
ncbi:F-box domain-containing protein [Mycena kentingensis (nom. inval.)]|nr:F-box domain-containing protein [Mycena kentingensis (nom. inval.)]